MKIPVHNPEDHAIYIGTSMILPGETRHFDKHEVPRHLWPKDDSEDAAPEPADLIADLLKLTVREVAEAFADLSGEDLDRLESLENASPSPRKTLLSALTEERLKRAAAEPDASQTQESGDEANENTDPAASPDPSAPPIPPEQMG